MPINSKENPTNKLKQALKLYEKGNYPIYVTNGVWHILKNLNVQINAFVNNHENESIV